MDSWIDEITSDENLDSLAAKGGSLSVSGREAATKAALDVVGRYFMGSSASNKLVNAPALDIQAGAEDSTLITSLRFRYTLAISQTILGLIGEILQKPTFRYSVHQIDSVGYISGPLDLSRFLTRPPVSDGPQVFPILSARQSSKTPENLFTVWVALWIGNQLLDSISSSGIHETSPEGLQAQQTIQQLQYLLRNPVFHDLVAPAKSILRTGSEEELSSRVAERLRRREVANAEPYERLYELVHELRRFGPTGLPGEFHWAFYGEGFDNKLFELWCLWQIARSISRKIGASHPQLKEDWRFGSAYEWEMEQTNIKLYFQSSITRLFPGKRARWLRLPDYRSDDQASHNGKPLGGVPDFILAIERDGFVQIAILDAKLRQREAAPSEELYKLLGYFDNFRIDSGQFGVILYYRPSGDLNTYVYQDEGRKGKLLALELNPDDQENSDKATELMVDQLLNEFEERRAAVGSDSIRGL